MRGKFLEVSCNEVWKAADESGWKSLLQCNVLDEQWTSNPSATGQKHDQSRGAP